jgi:hypothetical protein
MISNTEQKRVSKLDIENIDWVVLDKWYNVIEFSGNVAEAIDWVYSNGRIWSTPEETRREIGRKSYSILGERWKIYHNPAAADKYRS